MLFSEEVTEEEKREDQVQDDICTCIAGDKPTGPAEGAAQDLEGYYAKVCFMMDIGLTSGVVYLSKRRVLELFSKLDNFFGSRDQFCEHVEQSIKTLCEQFKDSNDHMRAMQCLSSRMVTIRNGSFFRTLKR